MKYSILSLFLLLGTLSVPVCTHASTFSDLVETFIAQGVVPSVQAEKARAFVRSFEQNGYYATSSIVLSSSQFIEHADRNYLQGETVRGLLLLAKNTADSAALLTVDATCPVVYSIYNKKDERLYTNADTLLCTTKEGSVSHLLPRGGVSMFEVVHTTKDFPLSEGVYRMEMTIPRYGKASVGFTVASPLL